MTIKYWFKVRFRRLQLLQRLFFVFKLVKVIWASAAHWNAQVHTDSLVLVEHTRIDRQNFVKINTLFTLQK